MENTKNYDVKFWNCFIPFHGQRSFIQMTAKINAKETIVELQKAIDGKRCDQDGHITLDFLKKKADPTKLYAKETIWHDTTKLANDTAKEHMPRAKAETKSDNPF